MFTVSSDLLSILRAPANRARDLVFVYELYEWKYDLFPAPADGNLSYDPRHAVALFAGQSLSFTWGAETITYRREVVDGPDIKKSIGKKFDTATIRFSNVSRYMASFVLNNRVQGLRLVVREIPRSANALSIIEGSASPFTHSIVRFVGRCGKPDGFDRGKGTISAKQDLGTIEAQIPERDFQPGCPLAFKKPGGDCLGNQTLAQKTLTYQAAKICNKTEEQCIQYGNEKYFQGTKVVQITSSFVRKSHRGFWTKFAAIAFWPISNLGPFQRGKRTVGNSTHDGTPYGSPIPVILGRWQKQLIPIQFRDDGETIRAKLAACRGLIKDFVNLRQEAPNFSQFIDVVKHLGDYGGVDTQTQDLVFPGGEYHSKLAYFTAGCTGSDVRVEDPAPDGTGLIAGQIVRKAFGVDGSGTGRLNNALAGYANGQNSWTDNPVDLARFIINDPAYLAVPDVHIAELATAITSAYTTGAIKDASNAERCLLPDTETANAGVEYKRYNSTGLLGSKSFFGVGGAFLFQDQRPGGVYDREAVYEFFDPDAPPTSLALATKWRKRYTANIEINEKQKAIDFLYDKLLVCFRGFLRWDHFGRLVIDCERPADHSYLRADVAAGATSISLLDVTRWKPLPLDVIIETPLRGKILIGAHKLTSEVRPVLDTVEYSTAGNSITLSASSSGAVQVDASGATLSGGSTSVPASGYVDILGTPAVGDQITITIDGIAVTILGEQEDITGTSIPHLGLVSRMCAAVNAEPLLNKYIEAQYGSQPADVDTDLDGSYRVLIYCKFGVLKFTTALEEDHFAEIADPVTAPTLASSAGALAAGTYLVSYAYRNTNGNTNISNIAAITITASKKIDVTGVVLPAGADSIDWFVSVEANSDVRLLVNNNNGTGFSITALPEVTAAQEPKINTTGEEILRVMYSDAQRALVYADTTRATHLDGTFEWPEGGRQSTINQVKGTYREAIQDFAEQPVTINDERHQEDTGQINPATLDLSAVDNYNQASRLLNGYLAKLRDQDFFFKWSSAGEPILLEIGDVVCLSDDSGEWRNVPVRIEDISYNQKHEVSFTCRLYSTSAFNDEVLQTQVPLPSGLTNYLAAPPTLAFDTVNFPPNGLEQGNDGAGGVSTIRGGITFGATIYGGQSAVVYVTRPGGTQEIAVPEVLPDGTLHGTFEFLASIAGPYEVCLQAVSGLGVKGSIGPCAIINVGLGAIQGDWIMPMITISGSGTVGTGGSGGFVIP